MQRHKHHSRVVPQRMSAHLLLHINLLHAMPIKALSLSHGASCKRKRDMQQVGMAASCILLLQKQQPFSVSLHAWLRVAARDEDTVAVNIDQILAGIVVTAAACTVLHTPTYLCYRQLWNAQDKIYDGLRCRHLQAPMYSTV